MVRGTRVVVAVVLGIALLAGVALAQEGVTLRYKWEKGQSFSYDLTMHMSGNITATDPQGQQHTMPMSMDMFMSLFSDVKGVSDKGLATVKVSLGTISTDVQMANGEKAHTEMDPATGKMRITAGNQQQETDLPAPLKALATNGMTMVVDDRGKVTKLDLPPAMQQAMTQAMPGLGPGSLTQFANWLDPGLPEGPIQPGTTWEQKVPIGLFLGSAGAPDAKITYTYGGEATIDGVKCHKIVSQMDIKALTMKAPPVTSMGLQTEMQNMSMTLNMTSYLSEKDTHLYSAQGQMSMSGTVHTHGTVEHNGQEVKIDTTAQMNDMQIKMGIDRQH